MNTLKLTDPMMHGPAVKRLQEMLDQHGWPIDIDGIYGDETEDAVKIFQKDHELEADGICGPKTWAALRHVADLHTEATFNEMFVDIRDDHPRPRLYSARRSPRKGITGVTLHQTGCEMPRNPLNWRRLNAHIGLTQEGQIVIVNDPRDFIWHAQKLSYHTIGIEIEGNYPGLMDDPKTLWKGGGGPHRLNPEMLTALDHLRDYLITWFATENQEWKYIHAHRQSAHSRIADPGEEIWKAVAIPWMEATGATDGGPGFYVGKGRPVPQQWSGDANAGDYRWTK